MFSNLPDVPHSPATSLGLSLATQGSPNTYPFLALGQLLFLSALDMEFTSPLSETSLCPFPQSHSFLGFPKHQPEVGSVSSGTSPPPTRTQGDLERENSSRTKHRSPSTWILVHQQQIPFLPVLRPLPQAWAPLQPPFKPGRGWGNEGAGTKTQRCSDPASPVPATP